MKARVFVTLKAGVLDPQGKAIEGALASLGISGVSKVRQGKVFDVEVAGEDSAKAESVLRQACERLLANTVIENYRYEVDQSRAGRRRKGEPAERAPASDEAARAAQSAAEDVEMPPEGHP